MSGCWRSLSAMMMTTTSRRVVEVSCWFTFMCCSEYVVFCFVFLSVFIIFTNKQTHLRDIRHYLLHKITLLQCWYYTFWKTLAYNCWIIRSDYITVAIIYNLNIWLTTPTYKHDVYKFEDKILYPLGKRFKFKIKSLQNISKWQIWHKKIISNFWPYTRNYQIVCPKAHFAYCLLLICFFG